MPGNSDETKILLGVLNCSRPEPHVVVTAFDSMIRRIQNKDTGFLTAELVKRCVTLFCGCKHSDLRRPEYVRRFEQLLELFVGERIGQLKLTRNDGSTTTVLECLCDARLVEMIYHKTENEYELYLPSVACAISDTQWGARNFSQRNFFLLVWEMFLSRKREAEEQSSPLNEIFDGVSLASVHLRILANAYRLDPVLLFGRHSVDDLRTLFSRLKKIYGTARADDARRYAIKLLHKLACYTGWADAYKLHFIEDIEQLCAFDDASDWTRDACKDFHEALMKYKKSDFCFQTMPDFCFQTMPDF
jgi:hypothetical protein